MTDEEVRATLLWLVERDDAAKSWNEFYKGPGATCAACGHSLSAHAVNGDADNPVPWPCAYPKIVGAPHALCTCNDYLEMRDDR
jgi:hypothetical protein